MQFHVNLLLEQIHLYPAQTDCGYISFQCSHSVWCTPDEYQGGSESSLPTLSKFLPSPPPTTRTNRTISIVRKIVSRPVYVSCTVRNRTYHQRVVPIENVFEIVRTTARFLLGGGRVTMASQARGFPMIKTTLSLNRKMQRRREVLWALGQILSIDQ